MKSKCVTIQMNAIEQYFQVLFVLTILQNSFSFWILGPVHRFKKLCEKLQLILLSNTRRSTSNCRADEDNKEERSSADEKRSCSQNSKLQLTQLSDTESEGEVLDSPRVTKKPLANNVNGKSAEKLIWKVL